MTKPIKRIAIVDAGKDTAFVDAVLDFVIEDYQLDIDQTGKVLVTYWFCLLV